jgi:hypothetical protein
MNFRRLGGGLEDSVHSLMSVPILCGLVSRRTGCGGWWTPSGRSASGGSPWRACSSCHPDAFRYGITLRARFTTATSDVSKFVVASSRPFRV